MKRFLPLMMFLLLSFTALYSQQVKTLQLTYDDGYPDDLNFWSDYPADELADAIVARMTDEELFAQMLMWAWSGDQPSDLLYRWVSERSIGSVKLYGYNTNNVKMVADAVSSLQQKSVANRFQIPLFVATDQEGGIVRHVKGDSSDTPGNLSIGAVGTPYDAYYTGYYIGRELAALGINMNFAPIIDIHSDPMSIMGTRTFSDNPEYVGILGATLSKGLMDAGVIPTAKHFPGHGDTSIDSHGKLTVINVDKETFYNRELVPYRTIIDTGFTAIMSGHLIYPQIDPDGTPASLSKYFIKDLLRNEMGFDGLVITDDMMMNGANLYTGGLSKTVRMAVYAGNDIIIFSETSDLNEALWRTNLPLMQSDPEFRECVVTAARRIIKNKLEYFKSPEAAPLYPDSNTLSEKIPDPEGSVFFLEQACRSITLERGESFPYTKEAASQERVLIAGPFISFIDEMKKRYPNADTYSFKYTMSKDTMQSYIRELQKKCSSYDTVIICVSTEESASIAESLKTSGAKVIIISALEPNLTANQNWADTILYTYSYSDFSFKAAAAVLAGEIPVYGQLPLELNRDTQ